MKLVSISIIPPETRSSKMYGYHINFVYSLLCRHSDGRGHNDSFEYGNKYLQWNIVSSKHLSFYKTIKGCYKERSSMGKRIRIVNEPSDIVPLLRAFGTESHKKVFDSLQTGWKTCLL